MESNVISKDLTVVIKPTRNCNLRCRYCSVGDPDSRTLTEAEVEQVIKKIVTRDSVSYTKFIWHGGEPLLAGLNFYRRITEIQKPLLEQGFEIRNVVQTNGTLITDDWAKFFKLNNFGVGLSVDGPKEINDRTRVFSKNKGAFVAIKKGAQILEENGVEYGYLAVISQHNVAEVEEIIDFMHSENKRYKLVAVSPIGRAAEAYQSIMPAGNSYAFSQKKLLSRWLKEGHFTDRSALWKYIVPVLTGTPIECVFFKNCQASFIGVDSNADVFPCGRFCGGNNYRYGNLISDDFSSIWNHPARIELTKRSEILTKCHRCKFFSICHGGCPLQGILNGGSQKEDYNCSQYFEIFSAIEEEILKAGGLNA